MERYLNLRARERPPGSARTLLMVNDIARSTSPTLIPCDECSLKQSAPPAL